ncbi:damage-inducible protein DinB [Brevibacillus sp. SYP-B805]|uniref:DinB family protein n=1 Tax=Brevibacillus sp. SYP-B805 TaxID=1578199 RepID=UPI0013EDCA0C|nr:DinB family protein [Brevibacillus sp. SYP-B805]NGQ95542.1 damage-inducible protein DinB [Brevibacillus sp. SYP-B805]
MMTTPASPYGYHVWATRQVIEHLKKLPRSLFDQLVESVFPSISKALGHIYRVDCVWLAVMSGDSFEQVSPSIARWDAEVQGISLEEMEEKLQGVFARYFAFLSEQEDLEKEIQVSHPSYGNHTVRLSDIIQHVVNHGTYHRGNITAMLRQMGHPGVPTDYIFYLLSLNGKS